MGHCSICWRWRLHQRLASDWFAQFSAVLPIQCARPPYPITDSHTHRRSSSLGPATSGIRASTTNPSADFELVNRGVRVTDRSCSNRNTGSINPLVMQTWLRLHQNPSPHHHHPLHPFVSTSDDLPSPHHQQNLRLDHLVTQHHCNRRFSAHTASIPTRPCPHHHHLLPFRIDTPFQPSRDISWRGDATLT